jgi:hypothetical protein
MCLGLAWAVFGGAPGSVRLVEFAEPSDCKPLHEQTSAEELSLSPRQGNSRLGTLRTVALTVVASTGDSSANGEPPAPSNHYRCRQIRERNGFGGPLLA